MNVGAVIPPHRLYSARAPIHPKRPYSLTRPVVPPDGSFLFSIVFRPEAVFQRSLQPFQNRRMGRNAAMLLHGL